MIPHLIKDLGRLQQAVLGGILAQGQVETGAVQQEEDGRGRVEHLDPLLPLALLPSHVIDADNIGGRGHVTS